MLTCARFINIRPVARAVALRYHMTSSTQVLEPDFTRVVGGVSKCRSVDKCRTVGQLMWWAAVDFCKV